MPMAVDHEEAEEEAPSRGRKKRVSEAAESVPSTSASTASPALTLGDMKILLREMTACEFSAPFIDAVDPSTAPGYSKVVSTPMALDTMRGHVRAGLYTETPELFVIHMRLISSNCLAYNNPQSEIARWAVQFNAVFEEKLKKITPLWSAAAKTTLATKTITSVPLVPDSNTAGPSSVRKGRPPKERDSEGNVIVKAEGSSNDLVDVESGVIRIPASRKSIGGKENSGSGAVDGAGEWCLLLICL